MTTSSGARLPSSPNPCMDIEVWKSIPSLGDYYQVSSLGRVRSVPRTIHHSDGKVTRHLGRVLKQGVSKKGYCVVWPSVGGKKKSLVVHRLVALAFLDNPQQLPEVNHKDERKTNNIYYNLEWCDTAYNVDYSQSESGWFLSPEMELTFIRNFSQFSRDNNLSQGKLSSLKSGSRKTHKGWRYAGKTTTNG